MKSNFKDFNELLTYLSENKKELWSIPLATDKTVSPSFIRDLLNDSTPHLTTFTKRNQSELDQIAEMMMEEGILMGGYSKPFLEQRRQLKTWWMYLSVEEKRSLKVHKIGNGIVVKEYFPYLSSLKQRIPKDEVDIIYGIVDAFNKKLFELGVINEDFVVKRKNIDQIYSEINSLLEKCKRDISLLWGIPIGTSGGDDKKAVASRAFFIEEFKATKGQVLNHGSKVRCLLVEFDTLMMKEGVIVEGHIASALEIRRKALIWWNSLTDKEKEKIRVFGNSIVFRDYVDNWRFGKGYDIVVETAEYINEEMKKLGYLDHNYVPVKERDALLDKSYLPEQSKRRQEWDNLRSCLALDICELGGGLPSEENPYPQLKHLFALASLSATKISGITNFKASFQAMKGYLDELSLPYDTTIQSILTPNLLRRFKNHYVIPRVESGEYSPSWATTIISCCRISLNTAKKLKGFDYNFYDVTGITSEGKTTLAYKPFSPNERVRIDEAIKSDMKEIIDLLKPYQPMDRESEYYQDYKNRYEKKARVIFEDQLDCTMVFTNTKNKSKSQNAFLRCVYHSKRANGLGLHEMYRSWGLLPAVDKVTLRPFVFRLAQILGMNSDPIMTLGVNDYVASHAATGRPCIRYWKERSDGGKELHLDLFNVDIQWLTTKQSIEVEEIFKNVKLITSEIRKRAPEDVQDRLFICYQSTRNRIKTCESMIGTFDDFVAKHNIVDDQGKPTIIKITRFRPSFVSDLVEAGVSIREIQLSLGHASLYTTMNYLDRLDFSRVARDKLKVALKSIHKANILPSRKQEGSKEYEGNKDRIIFQTPLAGCANIFNPPEFIRKSVLYVKGQPCSQYNKCLGCSNVLIGAIHLPELFAMQRDYLALSRFNRVMDTPYGVVVEENLSILSQILDPKISDFSEEELRNGEELSLHIESAVIDNFGG